MKIISIFNNKGGVGKTTLMYHLAHILGEMGKKVLILDLDPQCNMSLYGMQEDDLEKIWRAEEDIIDNGIDSTRQQMKANDFEDLLKKPRTIHFLLKSVEEGISDFPELPPPFSRYQALLGSACTRSSASRTSLAKPSLVTSDNRFNN